MLMNLWWTAGDDLYLLVTWACLPHQSTHIDGGCPEGVARQPCTRNSGTVRTDHCLFCKAAGLQCRSWLRVLGGCIRAGQCAPIMHAAVRMLSRHNTAA